MEIRKNIILIVVVVLFVSIAFSPSISAGLYGEKEKILTIWMPGITDDGYSMQLEITEEELELINDNLDIFLELVETTMFEESPGGEVIEVEEWQQIEDSVNDLINSIKLLDDNFPDIDTENLISDIIDLLLNPFTKFDLRTPMFSIGRGFTWIPLYKYEAFGGIMLRPMFTGYTIGFSAIFRLKLDPFLLESYRVLGTHRVTTIAFSGLFINFGDVGVDRIMGPIICIGRGFVKI